MRKKITKIIEDYIKLVSETRLRIAYGVLVRFKTKMNKTQNSREEKD